jgi:hypothetical protein
MEMKNYRYLLVITLFFSWVFTSEAQKVKLQYHLQAGDVFKYEVNFIQESESEIMGQIQNMHNSGSNQFNFKVDSVLPSGDMVLRAANVSFALSIVMPTGEMKFNSATDSVIPAFARIPIMALNQYYSFNLSPSGKISNLKAPKGLAEKLESAVSQLGTLTLGMGDILGANLGPDGFLKSMEGAFMNFPEGYTEPNIPWEDDSEINIIASQKIHYNYQLLNSGTDRNEIKVSAQITMNRDKAPVELMGMKMTYDLAGTKEGRIILDAATGLMTQSENTTLINGRISIDGPELPSSMVIPMKIRMVDKLTRI